MRSSRFVLLALAAVALAGCMQTGGDGPFSRNAPPLTQTQFLLPAMLRPAPVRVAVAQPMIAQPVEAQPLMPQQIAPQPVAQPVALAPEETGYALDSGDKLRVVVFGQDGLSASYSVDTSGSITMPLIGAVPARGRTPARRARPRPGTRARSRPHPTMSWSSRTVPSVAGSVRWRPTATCSTRGRVTAVLSARDRPPGCTWT